MSEVKKQSISPRDSLRVAGARGASVGVFGALVVGVRPRRGRTRREISPAVGGARAGWIGILHGGEVDEGNGPEVLAQGLLEGGRGHGRRGSFGVPARGVGGAFSMRWRSRWRVRSSCRVFWRVEIERSSEVTKNGEPTISVRPDYRQRREEEEKLP